MGIPVPAASHLSSHCACKFTERTHHQIDEMTINRVQVYVPMCITKQLFLPQVREAVSAAQKAAGGEKVFLKG